MYSMFLSRRWITVTFLASHSWLFGFPLSTLAQFVDKGDHVEVAKGTLLCVNPILDKAKGSLDSGRVFWKVTSAMRSNGTQTLSAFITERVYDRSSGNTEIKEMRYDQDYAILFKRDPEHKGMVLMVSPQDGRIEATAEVCQKKK
jgi:hypothetical protein